MTNPLGINPSKGWESTHNLRIRSTVTLPTDLRSQTEKVGDYSGGESRQKESKGTYECCAALQAL